MRRKGREEAKRTNEPGTCLWCGLKLHAYPWRDASWWDGPKDAKGYYGDGFFCGLKCAKGFAVVLARAGHRLMPEKQTGPAVAGQTEERCQHAENDSKRN